MMCEKVKSLFISLFLFGFSMWSIAQNPGNVGTTNLTAWFKPDGLTIGNVATWTTSFPTGASAFSLNDAASPYPVATRTPLGDVSNYNTTIHFTNTNTSPSQRLVNTTSLNLLDNINSTSQGTFVCAYYLPASSSNDHFVTYNETQDAIQFRNLGGTGRIALGKTSNSANATRNWTESFKPQLISYKGNRSSFGTMKMYNQSYLTTSSSASGSSGASGLYLGVKPDGGTGFQSNSGLNGYLHEVIFYNSDLTNTELLKVHSYLAVKYGVTLLNTGGVTQGDYLATSGITIWDASLTSWYHNDVIGIGRDDNQGLVQKQSHSFDDVTRVYIDSLRSFNTGNTGVFSSNLSYVMVGSNNGSMCSISAVNSEVPPNSGITKRLVREWKVTKTNMSDSLSFDFKTNNCSVFANASCLNLLVDDNGVFTNALVYGAGNGLKFNNINGVITVSGISNLQIPDNGTRYITIGVVEPNIGLGADTTICPGAPILLNATHSNSSYLWQDNSVSSSLTAMVADTYWVEVNLNGCIGSDTIYISQGLPPVFDLGVDTTICLGDTLVLNAVSSAATYLWSDGSSDSILTAFTNGTYWVQVTNGCGTTSDTLVLGITSYPVVNLGADSILCDGDTLIVDGWVSNASYSWQDGSVNSVHTVISSGLYWVDVTTSGCTSRDSVTHTFNLVPTLNIGVDTAICVGDTIALNPGNVTAAFVWQDGSVDSVYSVAFAGQYWVNVTHINCTASDTINVMITSYPIVNLGSDVTACDGDAFYVDAYNVNAAYVWRDGSTNFNLLINQADTFWVDVTINNCHSYDTVIYSYNPIPVIDLGNDTIVCFPDSILLDASYVGASYVWQDNSVDSTFEVSTQGTYSVKVTSVNCVFSDTILVTLQAKPDANLGNDTLICPNTFFTKGNAVPGATYLWQDGSVNFFYDIFNSGVYWMEITTGNCVNSDTIFVDSARLPEVYIGADTLMCVGDSLTLSSTTLNSVYEWSTGSADSTETVGLSGTYWLNVTNVCGTIRDEIELAYTTLPLTNLGVDTVMCMGDRTVLDAYWFNATRYLWLDGSQEPEFLVYEDGDYLVNVTNLCGSIEDTISIEFRQCECDLFIPNAFTPNGDGLDETFGPVSYCELKAYNFYIFDRWGKEVFNSVNPSIHWDGRLNGELLHVGMYTYILKYNFKKIGPKTNYIIKYGTFTLIK
ncbi:MAG: gliding motility-associated-like protein [Salibacteraceae bacterium]|jgi:gliding motility-associated-like protein